MNPINNYKSVENSYLSDYSAATKTNVNNFDIVSWIFKILKYWYLFLIVFIISFGLAYLKNKAWVPVYKTTSTVLIEENNRQGFGNDFSYNQMNQGIRNMNNQMIMYGSYDFIRRTVARLNLTNEVYLRHRFKDVVLYKKSPIVIESNYISDQVYGLEFEIRGIDEHSYEIIFHAEDDMPGFKIKGRYGESIQHALFFATINKTNMFAKPDYDLWFHFLSNDQLVRQYSSLLSYRFLVEESSVMEISLMGKVADRDVEFLNLLNEEYFDDNLAHKNLTAEKTIAFIDEQLSIMKDSVVSSESKINVYQAQSGIYTQDKSKYSNSVLDELDKQQAEIKLKKEFMKYTTSYLNKNQDNDVLVVPPAASIQDPQLNMLVNKYNEMVGEMKTLGSASPVYQKNKRELEDTKINLRESLTAMTATIKLEEENLNQRYGKAMYEISSLPQKERGLMTLERDFKIIDTYYTYLLQRRTESQIQRASNTPDNRIVDQPRTVAVVNAKEPVNNYLIYVSAGLLLSLLFVVCRESIFRFSIQSREEVESITGAPILGIIERTAKSDPITVFYFPKSSFAECFRNMRSRMEYLAKKQTPITMLITSTEPQDGKTFIAMNLASIYEQLPGKKTIIVDMDLRRPALSREMGMNQEKGVSNYLVGQADLNEVIKQHPVFGFDVLPAGTVPPNPSELICSENTKNMLKLLAEKYDYVLLDCSPVGLVSDAHFLARQTDVVLYVVRNDKTNKNFFKDTITEMHEDNIDNVAIIYNDVKSKGGIYHSRRYYGRSSYYMKHDSYYHESAT